jgi:hypothetical protein
MELVEDGLETQHPLSTREALRGAQPLRGGVAPLRRIHHQGRAGGQFAAGSAGVITGNGVNVKSTKENQRFLSLKLRRYGVRRQQD